MFAVLVVATLTVCSVYANQKCHGWPRKYNGRSCASTTNYHDARKGACGCGPANGDSQFEWNKYSFVAAASQMYFDAGRKQWCGQHCGQCVKLTTTGGFIPGQGGPTAEGRSVTFMITNLCPDEYPNQAWCSQKSQYGGTNQYGYEVHFDLENGVNQIKSILGWDNPEVTWEVVNCDEANRHEWRTPNYGLFRQCQCGQ